MEISLRTFSDVFRSELFSFSREEPERFKKWISVQAIGLCLAQIFLN